MKKRVRVRDLGVCLKLGVGDPLLQASLTGDRCIAAFTDVTN
ncbi:hypothetical protein QUB36_06345 [Microcoleus sp. AT8-B1]